MSADKIAGEELRHHWYRRLLEFESGLRRFDVERRNPISSGLARKLVDWRDRRPCSAFRA